MTPWLQDQYCGADLLCGTHFLVEVGNIVKYVNLDTRNGYGVYKIYIKGLSIFQGVMYLLVGVLAKESDVLRSGGCWLGAPY